MQAPMDEDEAEDGSDSESVESDVSVVKIVSNDPKAAARAAAILKMVRCCFNDLRQATDHNFII